MFSHVHRDPRELVFAERQVVLCFSCSRSLAFFICRVDAARTHAPYFHVTLRIHLSVFVPHTWTWTPREFGAGGRTSHIPFCLAVWACICGVSSFLRLFIVRSTSFLVVVDQVMHATFGAYHLIPNVHHCVRKMVLPRLFGSQFVV